MASRARRSPSEPACDRASRNDASERSPGNAPRPTCPRTATPTDPETRRLRSPPAGRRLRSGQIAGQIQWPWPFVRLPSRDVAMGCAAWRRGSSNFSRFPFDEAIPLPSRQIPKLLPASRRPHHRSALGGFVASQADQETPVAGGQVAAAADDEAGLLDAAGVDLDAGADGVAVAFHAVADEFQAEPIIVGDRAIFEQGD